MAIREQQEGSLSFQCSVSSLFQCCCCSVAKLGWLFVTPWMAAGQTFLSFMISQSLLKLLSIESVMLSNHLIPCLPLLLLPSIFPNIRVFSNELALRIRWPKDWSFSLSPSNEYSGLISFRIDWFDLLVSIELQRKLANIAFLCTGRGRWPLWASSHFLP